MLLTTLWLNLKKAVSGGGRESGGGSSSGWGYPRPAASKKVHHLQRISAVGRIVAKGKDSEDEEAMMMFLMAA